MADRASASSAASASQYPAGDGQAVYHFTPKHRWMLKNNLLTGITLPAWLRLLWRHGRRIDWRLYWQRAAFLTAMSAVQSLLGLADSLLYGRAIREHKLNEEEIVFVLGHPRTGTTLVHNMLAQDPRLASPTVFHCGFPSAFLWLQRFSGLFAPLIDETRPMDNMRIDFGVPCEDELATNVLTPCISPYAPITFMRDHRLFERFYTFEDATPRELQDWRDAFLWFLKKVSLQAGGKPLVVKSPVHTARVRLLLRLFPRARFIYLHRPPLDVLQSAAHMADTYYWQCYLQQPSDAEVTDFIFHQFELLHDAYMADRALIPPGHLVEVSFAELDADPLAAMQRIYRELGWGGERWAAAAPTLAAHTSQLHGFKKNAHRELPAALVRRAVLSWRRAFDAFGYQVPSPELDREEQDAGMRERTG